MSGTLPEVGGPVTKGRVMDTIGKIDNTMAVLEKVMDLRSRRHTMLSANVVNQDTPHYKAFDIAMEEELAKLETPDAADLELAHTDAGHLSISGERPASRDYRLKALHPQMASRDGNTVDIDTTMADMAENTLMYTALTRIMSKQLNLVKSVIKGGAGS